MNTSQQKTENIRRTYFLMFFFLIGVIFIGWLFSEILGNSYILYFAVGFSLFMNFFSYWFSDKLVLKMAGAKEYKNREENRDLFDTTERLVRQIGIPMPKLYLIQDSSPNAFATGRNPKKSAVAVTSGLLETLDSRELEGVLAHELAHINNRDILLSTVVVILVGFISLLADFFLRSTIFGAFSNNDDNRSGGLILIVGIVLSILAPIGAMLIQLAISRKREFLADASGSSYTHNPSALASALEKISNFKGPLKKANSAMAHMYISDPFKKRRTKNWTKLFMTHPPVEERIKVLRGGRI